MEDEESNEKKADELLKIEIKKQQKIQANQKDPNTIESDTYMECYPEMRMGISLEDMKKERELYGFSSYSEKFMFKKPEKKKPANSKKNFDKEIKKVEKVKYLDFLFLS